MSFQDPNRLYYEPFELRVFENIECEWPLFFCLSMLDFLFQGDKEAVEEYSEALEEVRKLEYYATFKIHKPTSVDFQFRS